MSYSFEPIGVLRSCYKEKFGIPRQAGLAAGADAILKLRDDPFMQNAVRELQTFSHVWLIFVFHERGAKDWKPSIRPPRLGGARKVGVLASRSPHRPNPIGLSAVKLERIDIAAKEGIEIHLSGVDILDGTPVLDIKPYLPYADSIPEASAGWAEAPITRTQVDFTEQAEHAIEARRSTQHPNLRELILQMVELDPRPAFQKRRMPPDAPNAQGTQYGFKLFDFDVKWEIQEGRFRILDLVDLPAKPST